MLDFKNLPPTKYCIEDWLRDEQIKVNLRRKDIGRIQAHPDRDDPIAVVGFGASLKDTWEEIRNFKYIITCSGAHKFLIERGIIPTWHLEVDPREHKVELLGDPHPDVIYLPASTVHPRYFDLLQGHKVEMWHIFEGTEESKYKLPRGEWTVLGGIDAGQRCMAMARFFGFWDQHVFGIDGSAPEGTDRKHAAAHPLQDGKGMEQIEYPEGSGRLWNTSLALIAAVKQIWHELDMMPSVRATFYGRGLIQEMAKSYVRQLPDQSGVGIVATIRPTLISEEYRAMNAQLHRDNLAFGVGGGRHAETVARMKIKIGAASVLDYGSGKGYLAKALPFPIWEYDPAIEGKDQAPRPAELVVCTDVLEHIEPDKLLAVLDDLRRVTKKIGFFVIHTGPSSKSLPDGRNAHLIQQPILWWKEMLDAFFNVAQIKESGPLLYCVVSPKRAAATRKAA
jgi:hypothetical protein